VCAQERKDGLMGDLSAPTRARLAELGTVRLRAVASKVSQGNADLERGEDEESSGHTSTLRARYGGGASPQPSGGIEDGETDGVAELAQAGGAGWHGPPARSASSVRFAKHARSASGTDYPLKK
jgi:hypothetical protein